MNGNSLNQLFITALLVTNWRRTICNRDSDQVSFTDESDDDFLENASTVDDNGFSTSPVNADGQAVVASVPESMDFEEVQSVMWRKHQLRRFFQDRGHWWSSQRRTIAWKWALVVLLGVLVAITGAVVQILTTLLTNWKIHVIENFIRSNDWSAAFFSYVFISQMYAVVAGMLCWHEPAAAGSGIPEIKAFLNGVSNYKVVKVRVLFAKVLGMVLVVSAGLPLGKEGPMIHAGSIIGAAVALGKTISFGFDTSWTKFQDFRNDSSKRDFVTFGAAAGIAAAFRAPIGGVLFTLEEGASFWSTTLTFRAFFCAMITMLTVSLIFAGPGLGRPESAGIFTFGQFDNIEENKTNYFVYELFVFIFIGCTGGALGACFNHIHVRLSGIRSEYLISSVRWKRFVELLITTFIMSLLSFIFPLMWRKCTPIPTPAEDWSEQERNLLSELIQFQCSTGEYNQLASLYFAPPDTAMRQLYHFREYNGSKYDTFGTIPLLLFGIPYFLMAAVCVGVMVPAGLFVPTLLAGSAYGRLWGHIMNSIAPGYVADSGTYALIGAAAMLGGMARMTISGTVIMLEAAGNMAYLLPLMVTFGASRYSGNAINMGLYEIQIELKKMPFLRTTLHSLGLLSYYPITEIMTQPVITFPEVEKVGVVLRILQKTNHNAFPIVSKCGYIRGLAMRKTLCTLLKLKAFSTPNVADKRGLAVLTPAATVFYDTLERSYPRFPKIGDIQLTASEMDLFLDMRPYMDTAPYCINQSASVQRCYRLFRTMGLRHLIVVDNVQCVSGIVTRRDVTKHRLEEHWSAEGHNLQKFINVEPLAPAHTLDGKYEEYCEPVEPANAATAEVIFGLTGGRNLEALDDFSGSSSNESKRFSPTMIRQNSSATNSFSLHSVPPNSLLHSPVASRHSINLFNGGGGGVSAVNGTVRLANVTNPIQSVSSDDSNDDPLGPSLCTERVTSSTQQ